MTIELFAEIPDELQWNGLEIDWLLESRESDPRKAMTHVWPGGDKS
jgi:hypothetical protein